MRTIQVLACSVRSALSAARFAAGLKLNDSREVTRSGGEDGLYRVTLANGDVVEATIRQYARAEVIAILQA